MLASAVCVSEACWSTVHFCWLCRGSQHRSVSPCVGLTRSAQGDVRWVLSTWLRCWIGWVKEAFGEKWPPKTWLVEVWTAQLVQALNATSMTMGAAWCVPTGLGENWVMLRWGRSVACWGRSWQMKPLAISWNKAPAAASLSSCSWDLVRGVCGISPSHVLVLLRQDGSSAVVDP